jgi:hypothetical protein
MAATRFEIVRIKSLAPDHSRIQNRRFQSLSEITGTLPYHNFLESYPDPIVRWLRWPEDLNSVTDVSEEASR